MLFVIAETSRECLVSSQGATTFDGLTVEYTRAQYTALSSGCKLLITQDCSDARLFAILGSAGKSWSKLQVLVPGQEIEYVWKEALVITVNGQQKNLEPSHPVIIYEDTGNVRLVRYSTRLLSEIVKNSLACIYVVHVDNTLAFPISYFP